METLFSANSAENYMCDFCHTKCSKKNDWLRHLQTRKHIRNAGTEMEHKISAPDFSCNCGKKYNTKSGLWKHAKLCNYKKETPIQFIKNEPMDMAFLTNLVMEVVKNNSDLQMMGQAMGGKGEFVDSENKIMKKIAKVVLIEKS